MNRIEKLLIAIMLVCGTFLGGCIDNNGEHKQINILDFPRDEGRHEGVYEAWNLGCYVTSSNGRSFFCGVVYQLSNSGDRMARMVGVLDVITNQSFFDFSTKTSSFTYDMNKLNLSYGSTDSWYQISTDPYTYNFIGNFEDEEVEFSFNFEIISNKGPTVETSLEFMGGVINESFLYDHTNVDVSGEFTIGNEKLDVSGVGVIDRVFGPQLVGNWHWFAVRLDNNYEIVAFKAQTLEGMKNIGWIVNPEGVVSIISDLDIIVKKFTDTYWTTKWFLVSKVMNFNLTVEVIADLIHFEILTVWEAACEVTGTWDNRSIRGTSFVEQKIRFLDN